MLIPQTGERGCAPTFGAVPTGLGFFIVIRTQDCRPGLYYDAPAGLSCCRADGLWAVGEAQGPSTPKFRCAQCALTQDDIRVAGQCASAARLGKRKVPRLAL